MTSILGWLVRWLAASVLGYSALAYIIGSQVAPPAAVGFEAPARSVGEVELLQDISWLDKHGDRQLEQRIFDALLAMIEDAESFILADLFLFNDWQGPVAETHRGLSSEVTDALIAKKQQHPTMDIVLISDPINTIYGGQASKHFEALKAHGINVILSDLTRLQDSNPLYSGIWRWLIRPFGNGFAETLPNPLGPGRVSMRSYLALLNFKANHRKLLIADRRGERLQALVMSANPHDGSSAHRNVALRFDGAAVLDLLISERALVAMSLPPDKRPHWPSLQGLTLASMTGSEHTSEKQIGDESTVRILTESAIRQQILQLLASTRAGDRVRLGMFYLSERAIIAELVAARARNVDLRVMLDVNKDAFGRQKNGVPNKPVAAELQAAGIDVRWCETRGEQCHAKLLLIESADRHALLLGSANFTRRNLNDFNLETDVLLQTPAGHRVMVEAIETFDAQWENSEDREFTSAYNAHAEDGQRLKLQYRIMEASGISTF